MAGISITVGLDDLAARERLRSLVKRMDRRRPFYAEVGEIVVASTGRRFAAETGPDGRRWTPLAKATKSFSSMTAAATARRRSCASSSRPGPMSRG